jgi:hypothetical protein
MDKATWSWGENDREGREEDSEDRENDTLYLSVDKEIY